MGDRGHMSRKDGAGVGPRPHSFLVVHRRAVFTDPGSRSQPSSLCRRHADLWFLPTASALLELQNTIANCVDDVSMRMRSNRLQLNTILRPRSCGLLPVDDLISCRSHHSESALTKSFQLLSFVTSEFISTLTSL